MSCSALGIFRYNIFFSPRSLENLGFRGRRPPSFLLQDSATHWNENQTITTDSMQHCMSVAYIKSIPRVSVDDSSFGQAPESYKQWI